MLDLNRLKNFISRHPRLLIGLSAIVVFILFLLFTALARRQAPVLPLIGPLATPTPTFIEPTVYTPPTAIHLNQAESVVRVSEVTTYIIPSTTTIKLNTEKIISQFQLSTEPETITTPFIQHPTWTGPAYSLHHHLHTHPIN